mmetsp:Transcript_25128/g.70256  ORF Transcript_25128/g.70256 Transcript_25128/m.70256 type:complete len:290 (-) Transcript_25128:17-886(-)
MLLLLQDEDHVAGVRVGMLVRHLAKGHLVTVGGALLDVNLKHLPLLLSCERLAIPPTCSAGRLHLLDHGAHADDLHLDATAIALAALLYAPLLVDDLPGDRQLLGGAVVQLLQGHLDWLHDVLRLPAFLLLPAAAATAAEECLEDVARVSASAAILQALLAVPIVLGPLLGVAQHLVGLRDFLELLLVAALVGVVLHRELPVGLLDVGVAGGLAHLQDFVELVGVRRLLAAAFAAHAAAGEAAIHAGEAAAEEHGLTGLAEGAQTPLVWLKLSGSKGRRRSGPPWCVLR